MKSSRGLGELTYGGVPLRGFIPGRVEKESRLLRPHPPALLPAIGDAAKALRAALEESTTPARVPSAAELLRHYRGGDVTILVDDHTRPNLHTRLLLPHLLRWLEGRGVGRERMRILVAGATHRAPREEEYARILGPEVWPAWRERTLAHDDLSNLATLGTLDDGFPVEINATAAASELIIPLTDLDYHYFAGVAGGPKQIMPGIASRALTTREHLKMFSSLGFHPHADVGRLDGNPVYEYKRKIVGLVLEEMARRGTQVYGLAAVLDPGGRLVHLAGGDILEVHRRGREVLDAVYTATIPRPAEVVITGARQLGLNLYQAGKAFNSARRAVAPGGSILVAAPCTDGWGNEAFRTLMALGRPYFDELRSMSPGEVSGPSGRHLLEEALRSIQAEVVRDFVIGKQKPVDLLITLLHVGWGHLHLLTDGLGDADGPLLPMEVHRGGADPGGALGRWVEGLEAAGGPTYLVVDDPGLHLKVSARQ